MGGRREGDGYICTRQLDSTSSSDAPRLLAFLFKRNTCKDKYESVPADDFSHINCIDDLVEHNTQAEQ